VPSRPAVEMWINHTKLWTTPQPFGFEGNYKDNLRNSFIVIHKQVEQAGFAIAFAKAAAARANTLKTRSKIVALEALHEIRRAEKEAQEMVRKAHSEGEKSLVAGQKALDKAIEEAGLKAKKIVEKKISQASKKVQEEVAKLRAQGQKEQEALKKRAAENMDRAVELVLKRFT
jgi:V/A-type H+-transporting ATPase subunit G/H